jgi:hypothetical protein
MDEDFLAHEFEVVLRDEPPLGFDPDSVVSGAARRQRRRRMTLAAAGGVVAVAVIAICVPLAVTGAGTTEIATADAVTAPTTSVVQAWPAEGPAVPALSDGEMSQRLRAGQQHFTVAVTKVFPDVTEVRGIQGSPGRYFMWGTPESARIVQQGYSLRGTVSSGDRLVDVELDIKIQLGATTRAPLSKECGWVPDGAGQDDECGFYRQADGDILVTSHSVFPLSHQDAADHLRPGEVLTVVDLRSDGTEVDARSAVTIGADSRHVLATTEQLTDLVGDPGFGLRG